MPQERLLCELYPGILLLRASGVAHPHALALIVVGAPAPRVGPRARSFTGCPPGASARNGLGVEDPIDT